MLKALSLALLLAFASPAFAAPKTECIKPEKFPNAVRLEGDALKKFREHATGLPEQVDLLLLLDTAPVIVAFVKGCAVGYGVSVPVKKPEGETL